MGLGEHPLFWAACVLAVASFAYGTYLLMAWPPTTTWPSRFAELATGPRLLCRLSIIRTYGAPRP